MDTDSRIATLALRLRDTRLLLLLLLSIAVCIALFMWRNAAIGLDEPLLDGRMAGYTAKDAFDVLGKLSSGDRTLYAITALTLDTIFPVLYVALMLGVIARVFTDARGLLALPLVVGTADLAENAAVAILALSYPGDAAVAATAFSPRTLDRGHGRRRPDAGEVVDARPRGDRDRLGDVPKAHSHVGAGRRQVGTEDRPGARERARVRETKAASFAGGRRRPARYARGAGALRRRHPLGDHVPRDAAGALTPSDPARSSIISAPSPAAAIWARA